VDDPDFRRLLDAYLEPPADQNPRMAGVQIEWVRGNPDFGSRHMKEKHNVTEEEAEQVLLEVPLMVEARRHGNWPGRTVFWGATRHDRWLVVVCEDRQEEGIRYLKPITAFEPDDGEAYWRRQ